MKKTIVLITNTFPYSPGEEFLETEIKYWAKRDDIELIIMPKRSNGTPRDLPDNITIDTLLCSKQNKNKNNLKSIIGILTSKLFYKEMYNNKILNPAVLKHTIIAMRDFIFYRGLFREYLAQYSNKEILFYSYWHTEVCYALQALKADNHNIKIVSRIHGYDLYQERKAYNYMPLKKQFLNNIDKIYTISETGTQYLTDTYGYEPNIVEVSRLGVEDRQIVTTKSKSNTLHLVSCSYLSQVKRIDKIIESLSLLASKNPNINYVWTHIGDGDLYTELLKIANQKFNGLPNINFEFRGHLDNQNVYQFYKNNNIDVFINVSESEGAPVTIMEAMSCHIPIVAPDVGGISEMVLDGINGVLLSSECAINEIVNALNNTEFYKSKKTRDNAYNMFEEQYSAESNYRAFIDKVEKI